MPVGDQDVLAGVFFNDCSLVTVVATGQTFMGFFEFPEQITEYPPVNAMAGDVAGKPTLQYATALAPELAYGVLLDVAGKGRWKVRNARQLQDGQVSLAELAKP